MPNNPWRTVFKLAREAIEARPTASRLALRYLVTQAEQEHYSAKPAYDENVARLVKG